MTAGSTELQVNNQEYSVVELDGNDQTEQYLTFALAGEYYGVDILRVQEIKGWTPVTHIPNTPVYIQGVLNLRGSIVPIVDMRLRFNMKHEEYTPLTVIIVLSVKSEIHGRIVGIVVDAVSDVVDVQNNGIKPAPDFGGTVSTEYISGLASVNEQMIMLLNIDKMLATDDSDNPLDKNDSEQ